MAKKGQKFNKINLETKLEICRKHFEEYVPETPLAKEYDLPIGTIRYIFNNYRKGYGFERKKGIDNRVNLAVYKLDKNTEEIIEEYHSISEAARKNNLEKANISKICNNYKTKKYKTKYQTCGGFKWKFKD